MRFTVVWDDAALNDLAQVWMNSPVRADVRDAADRVDPLLANDPDQQGEEFYGDRMVVIPPIQVVYRVEPDDRIVRVLSVSG
jgi:hypothetical protein